MSLPVQTLHDFVLNLLTDDAARSAFAADPTAALAHAGLSDVTPQDIQEVAPLVADYAPAPAADALESVLSSLPAGAGEGGLQDAIAQLTAVADAAHSLPVSLPEVSTPERALPTSEGLPVSLPAVGELPAVGALPLGELPIDAPNLGDLPVSVPSLGDLPVGDLPVSLPATGALPTGALPIATPDLGSLPVSLPDAGALPLGELPAVGNLPLGELPVQAPDLGNLPASVPSLDALPTGGLPVSLPAVGELPAVGQLPVGDLPVSVPSLDALPLGGLPIAAPALPNLPLGDLPFDLPKADTLPLDSSALPGVPDLNVPVLGDVKTATSETAHSLAGSVTLDGDTASGAAGAAASTENVALAGASDSQLGTLTGSAVTGLDSVAGGVQTESGVGSYSVGIAGTPAGFDSVGDLGSSLDSDALAKSDTAAGPLADFVSSGGELLGQPVEASTATIGGYLTSGLPAAAPVAVPAEAVTAAGAQAGNGLDQATTAISDQAAHLPAVPALPVPAELPAHLPADLPAHAGADLPQALPHLPVANPLPQVTDGLTHVITDNPVTDIVTHSPLGDTLDHAQLPEAPSLDSLHNDLPFGH
ncbi:IniB N-terminal domain-containing protein [Amycolatopsis sp. GM8]|uniref:IniB N-terminal domain-containing protein n=1 Tax=Amycolatopsis sp. GM8 TaxID=2896530 RepID=UPI001F47E572|nr:IniB N-terminal domain-containing protein [Amycolatopsis sp. GM8]